MALREEIYGLNHISLVVPRRRFSDAIRSHALLIFILSLLLLYCYPKKKLFFFFQFHTHFEFESGGAVSL